MPVTLKANELWQWLAVNEERLLLHDGLTRMADHIAVPSGVAEISNEDDLGLPVLDGKTPEELASIICKECSTKSTTYASLMEYRLNALRGLWQSIKEIYQQRSTSRAKESSSSSQVSPASQVSFASRVSLVLIFPIMKSLSKFDPNLSSEAASILLETLRACEPLSLSSEASDCIAGLESLLCSWLTAARDNTDVPVAQVQNAASALVALSVAVGTGSLLLRTVHILQSLKSLYSDLQLLVPGVLCKLLREHVTQEDSSALLADTHLLCWGYDDGLVQDGKDGSGPRSITFDGKYVYVTSSSLKNFLKLGTGKQGTIRGYVYANRELEPGWVVWTKGRLLFKEKATGGSSGTTAAAATGTASASGSGSSPGTTAGGGAGGVAVIEDSAEKFCTVIERDTLKMSRSVRLRGAPSEQLQTLQFMSDGMYVYWLYVLRTQETVTHPVTGERVKEHPVYLHTLELKTEGEGTSAELALCTCGERVLLQKALPVEVDKNSDVMKALVRANPSYATSTISSLLGGSRDDTSGATSTGLSMKILQKCAAYSTGSALVLLSAPPTPPGGRGGLFGVQGGNVSKSLCYNICFSIQTGKSLGQVELLPTPQLHCALTKGASMMATAACYDSRNHCVWTCNDDWIDVWDCAGKVRVAAHQLASRLGKSSIAELIPPPLTPNQPHPYSSNTISVSEAISLMLRHVGIESCRLVPGSEFCTTVVHNLPLSFLEQCCDLLRCSLDEKSWDNALAVVVTLQAVLPAFLSSDKFTSDSMVPLKERVRELVWELLVKSDCGEPLLSEAKKIISHNSESLYQNTGDHAHFISYLLNADPSQHVLVSLRDELLVQTAHDLQHGSKLSPSTVNVAELVAERIVTDSQKAIAQSFESSCAPEDILVLTASSPVFSPSLQCASMLINVSLRRLVLALEEANREREEEVGVANEPGSCKTDEERTKDYKELQDARSALLEMCEKLNLFSACRRTLETICDLARMVPQETDEEAPPTECSDEVTSNAEAPPTVLRQTRLQAVERAVRGSILGCILQPLLAVISNQSACTLQMANTMQMSLSSLAQLAAQACGSLYVGSGGIKIPAPWATGRLVETIHPVRDNYKFKETVSFPGAKHLYLKFDPRCSSQYDYDKVIVYAGDSPSTPRVAEYGGNTHGFGSRSVLGKGWPKDLVKVEGDTVTFTFEMKSGREHSTPDRAMWGLACTVRPQEATDESPTGLPFITDLYLSLTSVCCSLIGRLFQGPDSSSEEKACQQLLKYELLQKCVWRTVEGSPEVLPLSEGDFPIPKSTPHTPLPPVVIKQLRDHIGKPSPTLRPSIRELIQPDLLEDVIVSACLKQYGIESPLRILGHSTGSGLDVDANRALIDSIFNRINGLERRLQALAELERNWWHDVEDMANSDKGTTSSETFFFALLHHENTVKSFELLCCLKEVEVNHSDLFSTAKQLQDLLELDVEKRRSQEEEPLDYTPVTRELVKGVIERAQLLLKVTLVHAEATPLASPVVKEAQDDSLAVMSPTLVYARSFSAPPTNYEAPPIRRQRSMISKTKQSLLDFPASVDKSNLLGQIFQFIGSKPEEAVSCDSFLSAAAQQWRRGVCRVRALGFLNELLTSGYVSLAVDHLLASVGAVLRQGPRVSDIACGGMAEKVREAFAEVMHAVVELASKQPSACINTIAMLCVVPYTRQEEHCLVRSGLVKLLDLLCSLVDTQKSLEVGGEEDESLHRVTSLAWAGFQVLADRCVSWESQQSAVVSSGLAQQVSLLLTNHLSRAMERLVVSETGASEGLQDALSLLLGLAKSHMGRAILSQPACVSKLLLLLTDQRPSPKLVLIALQLCRIALPLMTVAECSQVIVPPHPSLPPKSNGEESSGSSLAADIVKLLLAKLAEYIVPDASQVSPKHSSDDARGVTLESDQPLLPPHVNKPFEEDLDYDSGQASVFVYKRENERAADILQPLISQDPRQFRLTGHRLQEVMQMDRALTENGKAEVATDSYRSCLRRALRWASMGFTVSIEHPTVGRGETSTVVDKKKAKAESVAKKKNLELIKTDPPRPFVSGHVAYSLASEVIGLLHGLLTEPGAAEVWSKAIKESMLQSLLSVPKLVPKLASYAESVHTSVAIGALPPSHGELLQEACIANATFAALGGFKESVRPGLRVRVEGEGVQDCYGVIQSISERKGLANVQFSDDEFCFSPNQTLEVPISRLFPPQKDTLPLKQLGVDSQLCQAIWSLLGISTPTLTHAHTNSDANTPALGLCRLFAELRTRASAALAYHVKDSSFSQQFLLLNDPNVNGDGLSLLSREARQSSSGLRVSLVESFCQSLRMLYRDCARPAPPRVERPRVQPKHIKLDISRPWPPVTYSSFAYSLTSVTYQGPTATATPPTPAAVVAGSGSSGSGSGGESPAASHDTSSQPKGVVVYANAGIPAKAPSFYWELEICHLGESSTDAAHIAMGYSPDPQKPAEGQPWAYPTGTILMRSSGRGCQVRGGNFLEWNTFRLNNPLKSGDIVGCGWVREEEGGATGTAYFTLNGEKQDHTFTGCPAEVLPFLHIQKKASRVRANFGERPFAYVEGHAHRDAADIEEEGVSMEEMVANFEALPFAVIPGSDSEGEGPAMAATGEGGEKERGSVVELSQTGPPTKKMKAPIATVGYDHEASQCYQVRKSFDTMLESGPLIRPGGGIQEEESDEGEGSSASQEEDLHALLVKAWETKVFPVIQRRFRNDQERKSGLEQIKGALQLGMESIAQETVEFLYEENGGIPRDLHLPSMDDVKAELGKFTISKVKKGSAVVVQKELPYTRCGVRTMQKTQGLTGIVLDIDESSECVQVECYLQNEGALVRFWYPVVYLERPPPGYRKSSALRGSDAANMLVHRELLRCEAALSSMYSRRALLLIQRSSTHTKEDLLDHLRLVSAECLADPLCEGLSTTTSPDLAPSPATALQTLNLSPLHLFYASTERMSRKISSAIDSLGLEKVEVLAQQVCDCLQRTPQSFGCVDLKITETKEVFDMTYPETVMMVVSCIDDKSASKTPPSSSYKYPWARVLVYRGGQGKGGRQQMQEVARYPNEMMQSSSNQYCGHTYPSLFLPFNRIHIKFGGCNTRPGKLLRVLALPPDFPLALSFIHILSRYAVQVFEKSPSSDSVQHCNLALNTCLESLSKFLNRLDVSIPLKELVMHQLADIMWSLCVTAPEGTQLYSLPSDCVQNVKQELQKVFETESSGFASAKSKLSAKVYPPPGSIAEGDTGRFSTYFQAILEFVLSALEYQHKFHGGEPLSSAPSLTPVPSVTSAPALVTQVSAPSSSTTPTSDAAVPATPSSESGPGKRSSKRSRVRKSFLTKKETSEATSTRKDEWLTTLRAAASLLRCVALESECVSQSTHVHEASIVSSHAASRPVSRLIVVTDIHPKLDIDAVQKAVHKTCGLYGGLYRDQLYLPVRENDIEKEEDSSESDVDKKEDMAVPSPKYPVQESSASGAPSEATPTCPTHHLVGHAVLELCSSSQMSSCSSSLVSNQSLQIDDSCPSVFGVSNSLRCGEDEAPNKVLAEYLRKKLMRDATTLEDDARQLLSTVFQSSVASNESSIQLEVGVVSGELHQFLSSFAEGCGVSFEEQLEAIKKNNGNEQGHISLEGFLDWIVKQITEDVGVRCVWLGLLATGYDLHFEKCVFSTSDCFTTPPTTEQDHALIYHVDTICRHLVTTAESIDTWDICLSDAHFASKKLAPLQSLSLADARMRFLQLKHINWQLSLLLPAIDLCSTHPFSLGCLLSKMSSMMFYDTKVAFLHSVINASTRRSLDQAPPEIKMDPLESVGSVPNTPLATHFCQATQQMLSVPSAQLCVSLASGGDPTYAFNVKVSGEEVHGTSGSFRQFLWQVVRELQSSVLPVLMPCPSGASGINHGKYILAPGPMTFSEEKLLQFFGQLLGVSVRADVPFAIDFLPCFWKSFKGERVSLEDLREADIVTYNLTNKILSCSNPEEFDELISSVLHMRGSSEEGEGPSSSVASSHEGLKFTLTSLDGIEIELCHNGKERSVDFFNREEYVKAVRAYRLSELASESRVKAIRCGFASVIPLQILKVFTTDDLDLRVCGIPHIDLEYLKLHTMYQVGLMETDRHVQYFWHALESFSQDELRKFIKFACNQERIPFGHPCRERSKDSALHVPPYPMKIAPPDGRGPPDDRYIRAETCMFMIKLPQYSSQQIMTERLRYAIHCREDPLSG